MAMGPVYLNGPIHTKHTNKVKIELQTMSWKTDWAEMVSKIKYIYTMEKEKKQD